MENHPDRRDSRRIIVGAEYTIRFVVKGHIFRNVRITNLSAGGCFAMVSQRDSGVFEHGTVLEQLAFEHPDLAEGGITAEVRFVLGSPGNESIFELMGLGVQFLAVPQAAKDVLAAFIERSAGAPGA